MVSCSLQSAWKHHTENRNLFLLQDQWGGNYVVKEFTFNLKFWNSHFKFKILCFEDGSLDTQGSGRCPQRAASVIEKSTVWRGVGISLNSDLEYSIQSPWLSLLNIFAVYFRACLNPDLLVLGSSSSLDSLGMDTSVVSGSPIPTWLSPGSADA